MSFAYRVRRAVPEDAKHIHELHGRSVRALCAPFYDSAIIEGWLGPRSPSKYLPGIEAGEIIVVVLSGEVLSFGAGIPGKITGVHVDPAQTGRGIGSLTLRHVISLATKSPCAAISLDSTLNAVDFYARRGFTIGARSVFRTGSVDVPVIGMTKNLV